MHSRIVILFCPFNLWLQDDGDESDGASQAHADPEDRHCFNVSRKWSSIPDFYRLFSMVFSSVEGKFDSIWQQIATNSNK